jgi:hypothetical protein
MVNNTTQQVEDIFGDTDPRQKNPQLRKKIGQGSSAPAKKAAPLVTGPVSILEQVKAGDSGATTAGPSKRSFGILGGLVVVLALVVGGIVVARGGWFSKDETSNQNSSPLSNSANSSITNSTPSPAISVPTPKPIAKDSDGDGLTDEEEQGLGTDLYKQDTDLDGLFDREEVKIYKTDPLKKDTDADGFQDGQEVDSGNNPAGEGKLLDLQSEINKQE